MPAQLCYRKSAQLISGPHTIDEKKRSVDVVGATEQPVEVFDPERWAIVSEVLLMSGIELPGSRQVPLIDSHQRERGSGSVLGSYRDMQVAGDQLLGRVHFTTAAEAESPWTKVREGHLTDFSVGYRVIESTWIPDGESAVVKGRTFQGPVRVTSRWRPKELSVVPIGADDQAKARGEQSPPNQPQHSHERTTPMPEPIVTPEVEIAIRAERERVAEIEAMCRNFNFPSDSTRAMIVGGTSLDAARKSVLEFVCSRQVATPPAISLVHDEVDKRSSAIIDGLCLRAGVNLDNPAPGASEYRGVPLYEIARESLAASGVRVNGLNRNQIVSKALGQRAHVTGDFPNLLANSLGKVLRKSFELTPATYERIVRQTDGVDFKEMSRMQLSEGPDLDQVPEHGEYSYGTFSDSKEVFSIQKYGKLFAITREALINDDLSAFVRVPLAFAMAARRKVNATVWGIITGNPTMGDGISLFEASTHKNFVAHGSGAVPGIATLTAARMAMRLQTGLQGQVLNVTPRYVLAPAALETMVDLILNSAGHTDDNKSAAVTNPFYKKLEQICEPLLDAADPNAWYLSADPAAFDVIELCWLGAHGPYLETKDGWTVDGTEFKVRVEFGVKALDFRGLYKNDGN